MGSRLNCAGWEDTIIAYVDSINIVNQIKSKANRYIIFATANGDTEEEMAWALNCSQQNINQYKFIISQIIRSLQI